MNRSRLILLAVVLVAAAAMAAWQVFWIMPEQDCVKHGGVWAAKFHSCAHPVTITTVMPPVPYDARPTGSPPASTERQPAPGR